MISGLDLNSTVDYVLKNDKDNPTIWKLGVIPSYVYSRLLSGTDDVDRVYRILQVGLRGWVNFGGVEFKTEKDKVLGYEIEVVPMELLQKINIMAVSELAMELMKINSVTDDEKKN